MPGPALPGLLEYYREQNREEVGRGHTDIEKKSKEEVRENWGIQVKIRWSDKCTKMIFRRSGGELTNQPARNLEKGL